VAPDHGGSAHLEQRTLAFIQQLEAVSSTEKPLLSFR
jgi:hypothetical protein